MDEVFTFSQDIAGNWVINICTFSDTDSGVKFLTEIPALHTSKVCLFECKQT